MPRNITVNQGTSGADSTVSDDFQKWDAAAVQSEYGADKSSVFNPTVEDYYSENDDHGYSNVTVKRSDPLDRGRKKSVRTEDPINIGSTSSAQKRHRGETREKSPGFTEFQKRHVPKNVDGHSLTSLPLSSPRLKPTSERYETNDQDLARLDGEKKKTGGTPEPTTDVLGNDDWGEFSWGSSTGKKKKGKKGKALEVEAGGSSEKEGKNTENPWAFSNNGKNQAASGFDFDFTAISDPVQVSTPAALENDEWGSFARSSKAKKKSKKGVAEEPPFPAPSRVIPEPETEPTPEPEPKIVDDDWGFSSIWEGGKKKKKKKKGKSELDLLNDTPPPPSEPDNKPIQSKLEPVPELSETSQSGPELVKPHGKPINITINHSTGSEQYSTDDEEDSSGVQVSSSSNDNEYTDAEEEDDEEWDYIDEIEPIKHRRRSSLRPRPLPRRYSSPTSRRPRPSTSADDGYDDNYPGYGPPGRPPLANSSAHMHKPSIGDEMMPFGGEKHPLDSYNAYNRQPYNTYARPPFTSYPGQPYYSYPGQPYNSYPGQPYDSYPRQPYNSYPGQPYNSYPEQTHNSYSGQPYGSYPGQPYDPRMHNPYAFPYPPPPSVPPPAPPSPPPPAPPPPGAAVEPPSSLKSSRDGSESGSSNKRFDSRGRLGSKSWDRRDRQSTKQQRKTHRGNYYEGTMPTVAQFQMDSKYHAPLGQHGEPLWMEVKVRGLGKRGLLQSNLPGSWQWPEQGEYNSADTHSVHLLRVIQARRWFDTESHHVLDMTCAPRSDDVEGPATKAMTWLHVESVSLDFDDFCTIVLSRPGLSNNWKIVLLSLLNRVRNLHRIHGSSHYFPWVMRADSSEMGLSMKSDAILSATSVSFPYFAVGPLQGHGPKDTVDQYPIMSLFEWDNRFESAKEWDSEQIYRIISDESGTKDSIIYVPHVWSVVFDRTIITYGPVAFNNIVDNKAVNVHVSRPGTKNSLKSIHVVDLHGLEHELPFIECRTFFALKQSIQVRCFPRASVSFDDIDILLHGKTALTGELWVRTIQQHNREVFDLKLRTKRSTSKRKSGHAKMKGAAQNGSNSQSTNFNPSSIPTKLASDDHSIDSHSEISSVSSKAVIAAQSLALVPYNPGHEIIPVERIRIPLQPLMLVTDSVMDDAPPASTYETDKSRLEASGIIVYDPKVINRYPEIYQSTSTAMVRFDREQVDAVQYSRDGSPTRSITQHDRNIADTSKITSSYSTAKVTQNASLSSASLQSESASEDVSSKIHIPHFLSWATNSKSGHAKDDVLSESSIEYIEKILDNIQDTLMERKADQHKRIYRRTREMSQGELHLQFPSLKEGSTTHRTSGTSVPISGALETEDLGNGQRQKRHERAAIFDDVQQSMITSCNSKVEKIWKVFFDLLALFIPLSSSSATDHTLVRKCCGALSTLITDIQTGLLNDPEALRYKDPEWWVVRDISSHSMLSNQRKPIISFKECEDCNGLKQYNTMQEGISHVRGKHFQWSTNSSFESESDSFASWLRSDKQYYRDHRLDLYTFYLELLLEPISVIFRKSKEIWDGVASDHTSMVSDMMLPQSLVSAFESAVLLLVCTARSFSVINRCSDPMQQQLLARAPKARKDRELLKFIGRDLHQIGHNAKVFISKAEQDIMLMAHTDVDTDTVSYESVGPEYILATIMTGLFTRAVHKDESIDSMYGAFYRRLHHDAMKHPRTRVLRKIWRMTEELELVQSISGQQQDLLRDYLCTLEPRSFRTTTLLRRAGFPVEHSFIETQLRKGFQVRNRLIDIDSRLEDVSNHVSRMLEIQKENNGNAIIVFTIVTIIFLPLSWATSYLGMNTVDVRNLEQGQWLFWTIALPVTTVVIGLAVLVVLKGESIREFLIKREAAKDRGTMNAPSRSLSRRESTWPQKTALGRSTTAWKPFVRRRKVTKDLGDV